MNNALRHWLLQLAATIGFAGTLFTAEAILSRHNWRIDLTPERRFTLSDHSRQVLTGLDRTVDIIAFVRSEDARNSDIEDLLQRMRNVSPHVRYSVVDVNRNPAVARRYGVDSYGRLLVESNGQRRDVTTPREDVLMAAILAVTHPTPRVVYFLAGHGEADLNNTDRDHGYSAARDALQSESYDARPLPLLGEADVPADASALVIAGPRRDLLPAELAKVAAYVDRGGSLLILLEPDTVPGLTAFLDRYGVRTAEGVIVDPENGLFAGDSFTITVTGLSDQHPASATLKALPLFSLARAVSFPGTNPGVRGIEFLRTSPSSWRTPQRDVVRAGVAIFVGTRDQAGPLPVGVSLLVDRQGHTSAEANPIPPARLIILGDSDFAGNFFIEYLGNKDLLLNAINWLAGEQALLGQRPQSRTPGVNQFFVSARQGRLAFVLGTVVEPALVLLIGAMIFLRRRWRG